MPSHPPTRRSWSLRRHLGWLWIVVLGLADGLWGVGSGLDSTLSWGELMHDFGRVPDAGVLRYDFVCMNTSGAPVHIGVVRSSCGCTVAGDYTREIAPGGRGVVPVEVDPGSFDGRVTKTLTVLEANTDRVLGELGIQAEVWHPVAVSPSTIALHRDGPASLSGRSIIRIEEQGSVEVKVASHSPEGLEATIKARSPGRELELTVQHPYRPEGGNLLGEVRLVTTSAHRPELVIPVWWIPPPPIQVSPQRLVLARSGAAGNESGTLVVTVENHTAEPIKVTEAMVDGSRFPAEVTEVASGRLFRVEVKVPPGLKVDSSFRTELRFRTTHPGYPVVTVPILGPVQP